MKLTKSTATTLLFLMAFLTMLPAVFVFAANPTSNAKDSQMVFPATSEIIQASITLNAEINGTRYSNLTGAAAINSNISNVTFQLSRDDGSTWTDIAYNVSNINNFTISNWSVTFNTATVGDVASGTAVLYRFRARAYNGSGSGVSGLALLSTTSGSTSIRVDNTIPVLSWTSPADGSTIDLVNPSITVNALNATKNSSCQVFFSTVATGPFQNFAMVSTNNDACRYTASGGSPADSMYTTYAQATDGYNVTALSRRTFNIDFFPNGGGSNQKVVAVQAGVNEAVAQSQSQNYTLYAIIVAIAGFILLGLGKKH